MPIEEVRDIAAEITAGAVATLVTTVQGASGMMTTDCKAFGEGVEYIVIISEGAPLAAEVVVNSNVQVVVPANYPNRLFVSCTGSQKRIFGAYIGHEVLCNPHTCVWRYHWCERTRNAFCMQ